MSENEKNDSEFTLPKKTFTLEFVVGIFSIIGLACLAYLAVNIAGIRIVQSGYYDLYAEFDNISGLNVGSSVEIAGVSVGSVKAINLNDTTAVLTLEIEDHVKIRDDDMVAIRTKGIIGDRYVKISPGGSDEFVEAGGTISDTESVVELEEIIGKVIHSLE